MLGRRTDLALEAKAIWEEGARGGELKGVTSRETEREGFAVTRVDIVDEQAGQLKGTVTSVTFKGVHYDTIVDFYGFKWLIQTTDYCPVGSRIGIKIDPDGIHVMKKSQYSGLFGDYSSYSEEYDEIGDADFVPDEEEGSGHEE